MREIELIGGPKHGEKCTVPEDQSYMPPILMASDPTEMFRRNFGVDSTLRIHYFTYRPVVGTNFYVCAEFDPAIELINRAKDYGLEVDQNIEYCIHNWFRRQREQREELERRQLCTGGSPSSG